MRDTYSLYEAKARLSAIVRQVREGHPVTVTLHGEPAVEIRAIPAEPLGIDARLDQLAERGVLIRSSHPSRRFRPLAKRPGALKRFLADRNE
jgi:prevent-host-death family protein